MTVIRTDEAFARSYARHDPDLSASVGYRVARTVTSEPRMPWPPPRLAVIDGVGTPPPPSKKPVAARR